MNRPELCKSGRELLRKDTPKVILNHLIDLAVYGKYLEGENKRLQSDLYDLMAEAEPEQRGDGYPP